MRHHTGSPPNHWSFLGKGSKRKKQKCLYLSKFSNMNIFSFFFSLLFISPAYFPFIYYSFYLCVPELYSPLFCFLQEFLTFCVSSFIPLFSASSFSFTGSSPSGSKHSKFIFSHHLFPFAHFYSLHPLHLPPSLSFLPQTLTQKRVHEWRWFGEQRSWSHIAPSFPPIRHLFCHLFSHYTWLPTAKQAA